MQFQGAKVLANLARNRKAFASGKYKSGEAIEPLVKMLNSFPLFNLERLETLIRKVLFIVVLGSANPAQQSEALKAVVDGGLIV